MIIQPSAPRSVRIAPGIYPVVCIGVREAQLANPQYGRGEVLFVQLQSQLKDPETGEWVILERMCNMVWSPRSSLWACAEALGYPVKVGESLDTDRLSGLRCQAVVKDEVGSDGLVYSRVDTLVPVPASNGPAPWEEPEPPAPTLLRDQIYAKAEQLAQQGHARDDAAFPPLEVLTQSGQIDWDVFWRECAKRGISRQQLGGLLGQYDHELDGHLRQMMPLAVTDLLKGPPPRSGA